MKTFPIPLALVLGLVASSAANLTFPETALEWRVRNADHIFVGKVVNISVFEHPTNVVASTTMTVPRKKIFVRVTVEPEEVLLSPLKELPKRVEIDEDYLPGHPTDAEEMIAFESNRLLGKTWIFLLKGAQFKSVFTGYFVEPVEHRADVLKLIKDKSAAK